tara:strand:+ start:6912 stop:7070 length:159 start_codon:yes stop_codon:yes gene_type:complete
MKIKKYRGNGVHPELLQNFQVRQQHMKDIKKIFGSHRFKKPTQQIVDELDES